jgi:SNF2 family DNA or RNA helicase
VYNWLAEFATFAPEMKVRALEGDKRNRARILHESGVEVLVASYDLVRIDEAALSCVPWYACVLDEAQYIKNHTTLTTRAVKRLHAQHKLALTGTPIENRLSEVWSIFDFLMPGFFGSYARFRERYELGILGGDEELTHRLQSMVGPFIMRRVKEDVLPDLPDKIEQVVYVPLEGEQRKLYAAHEQQLRVQLATQKHEKGKAKGESKVKVLAELTKLRQVALDPNLLYENVEGGSAKTGAVLELIDEAVAAGKKVLVFSQFTSYLRRLATQLEERGLAYYRITGATPKKQRVQLVDAFNEDDTPVFLVSLKAGGTGLNLTGASVVIHADPWWNAAATNQATDRAHRLGQKNKVSVYKVIAKGTIEERILKLQQAKSDLADAVVGEGGGLSLATLTPDELLALLSDED